MSETSNNLIVFDTTLRDGEQSPGISLDTEDKIIIANQLGELGVDVIEAGFPISSQGDFEAVQAVAEAFSARPTTICGLSRTALKDVERCWEAIEPAANSRIHVFIATSDIHMRSKLRMTPEQVIAEIKQSVAHAKQFTNDVEFSPEDASRSDFDFMCLAAQVAVDHGATTLNIPDTTGWADPDEWRRRISDIRKRVKGDYIISTHCHDDFGMATANTLAAVKGGARQVEVTINGIGERAGNAALEEVVMSVRKRPELYGGLATTINTSLLVATSQMVSELTGYAVPPNKAVVGNNAFAHEAGIHAAGVLKDPSTYEVMDPNEVGSRSEIVVGKHSGKAGIVDRLQAYAMPTTMAGEVVTACKQAVAQFEYKRALTDVEIEIIAASVTGQEIIDRVQVADFETRSEHGKHFANISIQNGDVGLETLTGDSEKGTIAATFDAIQKRFGNYEIRGWDAKEQTGQHGAEAQAFVCFDVVTPSGEVYSTCATAYDTVEATALAFMRVVNLTVRSSERRAFSQA